MSFRSIKLILFFFFVYTFSISARAEDAFDCVGLQNGWRLTIAKDKFTFQQGDTPLMMMTPVKPSAAENMSLEHIKIYRTMLNNKQVIIILQKQSCSEGNSEELFQYEGLFITHDKVFHGCCSEKILLTH